MPYRSSTVLLPSARVTHIEVTFVTAPPSRASPQRPSTPSIARQTCRFRLSPAHAMSRLTARPCSPLPRREMEARRKRDGGELEARRRRSRRAAHQSKDLEEAVLQMCNMLANSKDQAHHTCLCSRFSLGCTPGRTADLADEHEHVRWHVERAGLGQVHHEGEVHDAQASAPASSSLGDHARHPHIPPYRCSNKQMASKLATGSSSSTAVGERTARTTIEHSCSHRRHERRERRGQRHLPVRLRKFGRFSYIERTHSLANNVNKAKTTS